MTARGEARRRMTGWMADRTKSQWATYASELEAEIERLRSAQAELRAALQDIADEIHKGGLPDLGKLGNIARRALER